MDTAVFLANRVKACHSKGVLPGLDVQVEMREEARAARAPLLLLHAAPELPLPAPAAVVHRPIEFRVRHLSSRVERSACCSDLPVWVM